MGRKLNLIIKAWIFSSLKRYDADKIINVTLQLIKQKLPKFVDASEYDIQVLTPMRKGLLGVERLNNILQVYLNPPGKNKKEKEHRGVIFREGDKAMQIKIIISLRGNPHKIWIMWIKVWEFLMEIQE